MADYTNDPNVVRTTGTTVADDNIQHGIDDSPTGDAAKGGILGAVGGAVVGALAGGPIGAVIGALAGGALSGAAVAAVDAVDNDNNISGIGDEIAVDGNASYGSANSGYSATADDMNSPHYREGYRYDATTSRYIDPATGRFIDPDSGRFVDTAGNYIDPAMNYDTNPSVVSGVNSPLGNTMPGIQTGGYVADGSTDTRGVMEKTADAATGDNMDDKTGKTVNPNWNANSNATTNYATDYTVGNGQPGVQTGGRLADGSMDTRGVTEKVADVVTGDNTDDKTGKRVS